MPRSGQAPAGSRRCDHQHREHRLGSRDTVAGHVLSLQARGAGLYRRTSHGAGTRSAADLAHARETFSDRYTVPRTRQELHGGGAEFPTARLRSGIGGEGDPAVCRAAAAGGDGRRRGPDDVGSRARGTTNDGSVHGGDHVPSAARHRNGQSAAATAFTGHRATVWRADPIPVTSRNRASIRQPCCPT